MFRKALKSCSFRLENEDKLKEMSDISGISQGEILDNLINALFHSFGVCQGFIDSDPMIKFRLLEEEFKAVIHFPEKFNLNRKNRKSRTDNERVDNTVKDDIEDKKYSSPELYVRKRERICINEYGENIYEETISDIPVDDLTFTEDDFMNC
jgi:hypothetical protein